MTTAIVLGATGLVGSELVKVLQASPFYNSVLLLGRRSSRPSHPKVAERIIDFDAPDLDGINEGHLYCALGTTLQKAGSKAAQFRIDCEYPTTIARRLRMQGVTHMLLVSSIGADARSRTFYTRTKGQLEENIIGLKFDSTLIFRPSVLMGDRPENRMGEEAAIVVLKVLSPLMIGGLRKYRGIEARTVAASMVRMATSAPRGVRIVESDEMEDAG